MKTKKELTQSLAEAIFEAAEDYRDGEDFRPVNPIIGWNGEEFVYESGLFDAVSLGHPSDFQVEEIKTEAEAVSQAEVLIDDILESID